MKAPTKPLCPLLIVVALSLLTSCERNAVESENVEIESIDEPISKPTEADLIPSLRQEFHLLELQVDNFFRDEERYFEEVIFWADLVLNPAETEEEKLVALNSAPVRNPSAFYDLKSQASTVILLFDQIEYHPARDGNFSEQLRTLNPQEVYETATNILKMDTPFSGSNFIDAKDTIQSDEYQEFESRFTDAIEIMFPEE